MKKITHARTKEILGVFEELSKIPRCSKHEEKICEWLLKWADDHKFEAKLDEVGNVCIKVPAPKGYEESPTVVLQGHVDMVCEKTPDSRHDFSKDPIKFVYDGDWLKADRTTLGADNGIAIAMALIAATDKTLKHPPFELLFTVDEETGLTGASSLKPGFISGKILLNIDSEDEGYLTVGCAGGINTRIRLLVDSVKVPRTYESYTVMAGGMKGGHSGVDIHLQKANAIIGLARALNKIRSKTDLRISGFTGGTAHNAIPRDAEAQIFVPEADAKLARSAVKEIENALKDEFGTTDPDLFIKVKVVKKAEYTAFSPEVSKKVLDVILALPHGVASMSKDIAGLVETSNNLANVRIEDGIMTILTSQRSSKVSSLMALTRRIEAVGELAGGISVSGEGYPPWPPRMDSPLLKTCTKVYERLYKKKPVIDVIHAGLECGIIGDRTPGMDMISFGPTIKNPHSPDEKIHIGTIGLVWDFMEELFKELK